ncbi:MAG: protein kinase [Acidobacteria bacterium]|nr:protein kinase [Acidobacteriota bacterium]
MIGTAFAHYRVEALLGRGGMGEVYRASDARLDRPVAIKVLAPQDVENRSLVERFLREARAASSLNHPNIVTIYEAGQSETGSYYIVQELVEGETLRRLLAPRLPVERALALAVQLARALGAAHAAGIVHRDIKPENIMVRPDGYLKVLDFGLARMTKSGESSADTTLTSGTEAGTVLGTVGYMSPEQAEGRASGPPGDVFSVGIVLYEMLAGVRPFVGENTLAVLHAILSEHPVPPSRLEPDVPPAIDSLLLSMLDKAPERRPSIVDVLAELESSPTRSASPTTPPPLDRLTVGRRRERDAVVAMFDRVAAGQGAMVAVTGEPGMGKSTLVEQTLAELGRGPHRPSIARGRCSERLAGTEAFVPIFDALDQLLHTHTLGGFNETMRRLAPTWYVQVAPLAAESTSTAQMREETSSASLERMKRELATFFQEVSRIRPLVLFFEDIHWADLSSTDVFNFLADRFDQIRVLVIVTYRPSDMAAGKHAFLRVQQSLVARNLSREVPLDFLNLADIQRYLALVFPGHALPDTFAELIHQKTEGNPLFMADLVRYLRDQGVIAEREGHWILARAVPDIARDLPDTVRSTISRKIDQLDELDQKLMTVASVQGHEFDARVLSDVLGMDAADAEDRLAAIATSRGLIRLVDTREYPDRELAIRYRFVHVLYQNVLFASLQPTRRASLSVKVSRSLLAHYGEEAHTIAAELAVLFETGRDFAQAARFFQVAAARAVPLFAYREAVLLARRGLEALKAVPPGPARTQQELGLQVYLGLSLRSIEGWAAPEVEQIYVRARELCQELGDAPTLFPVLWGLTLFHAIRGDLRIFIELADHLLLQAEETGRHEFLIAAHQMNGSVNEFLGNTTESNRHFESAIERHDPSHHKQLLDMFGLDPGMIARSLSPRPMWFLGRADQALARAEESVRLSREQRQTISLVFALCLTEHIHLLRREPDKVVAVGDEEIALCREYGLAQELEWGRCFQAAAFVQQGRVADALEQLRDSLRQQQAISSGLLRPMFLCFLVEALLAADQVAEGLSTVDEGLAWGDRTLEQFYRAELLRLRGELLRRRGDLDAAESSMRAALNWANDQRALGFELRAAMSLCRLVATQGRGDEGRAALEEVYTRFTEGFDTGDLVEARRMLEE